MESQDEDLVKRSELTAESTEGQSDTTTFYIDNAKHVAALEKLLSDPLLADLPARPTVRDVETLIALEKGSAMKLKIIQMDGVSYEIPVLQSAAVGDLNRAFQRKVEDSESRQLGRRSISW